jgi:hypothetical protein
VASDAVEPVDAPVREDAAAAPGVQVERAAPMVKAPARPVPLGRPSESAPTV